MISDKISSVYNVMCNNDIGLGAECIVTILVLCIIIKEEAGLGCL